MLVICLVSLAGTALADLVFNYGVAYGTQLDRVPNVTAAQLGVNPVGVNMLLQLESDPASPQITRSLDMAKAAGFGFIRLELPWEQIEPQQGQLNWGLPDAIVQKATDRGLLVLFRLDRPPNWSRLGAMESMSADEKNRWTGPPDRYEDYFSFVGQVAARYKGRVKYYQIWNEPNLLNEWNGRKVDALAYVRLLGGAFDQIKAADPAALVLTAPLAPTDVLDPDQLSLNDLVYLDQMYKAGARAFFDIFSLQLYALGYDPNFRFIQPQFGQQDLKRVNFNRPASVHEVMIRNGDGGRPVWASEYGWISVPAAQLKNYQSPAPPGHPNQWGDNVSAETQGTYLVEGIKRVRREWPWIGVVNVWFFRADDNLAERPQDPTNYWAIVDRDFQPRPAYTKLKDYLSSSSQVDYTGWDQAAGNPALQSGQAGSLRWQFQGERAELVARTALNFTVKIDDQPARSLNVEAGSRVTLAEGLNDGLHKVEFGGVNRAGLEGFYVSRDNHWNWLIAAALLLSGLGALASGLRLAMLVGQDTGSWTKRALGQLTGLRRNRLDWKSWVPLAMVAALLLYYFAPPVPLAVLGLFLFFPLCFWRPDCAIGLAALTSPLFLHPRNLRPGGTLEFSLSEVIIVELALAALIGGLWQLIRRRTNFLSGLKTILSGSWWEFLRRYNLLLALGSLFLLATLSLLVPPSYHLKEALREYREVIFEPVALFILALLYLGKQGSRGVARIVDFLVVAGTLVALVGIYQFFFPARDASKLAVNVASQVGCTVSTEDVVRVCSVFSHPDSLGLFLGRVLPLTFGLAAFWREIAWRRSWRRRLYTLALLPMLITLGLSYSRGAWLGLVVALLVMLLAARAKRGLLVYGAGIILVVAALPFIKVERIISVFNPTSGSGATRLYIWQAAVAMIKDHSLTGVGLDQFLYYYNPGYVNPLAWTERFTSHPHNMFLDFWLRLGVLGPVVLLWLLIGFGWLAWRLARPATSSLAVGSLRPALSLGLLGSMVDFAVHGLVDNSFFMVDLAVIFCLSVAFLQILQQELVKEQSN